MLLNGCFHTGPVTGLSATILVWGLLYWPEVKLIWPSLSAFALNTPGILATQQIISRQDTFFNKKVLIFFLFLHQNIMLWYSLEVPHWGTSNKYPICFLREIRKTIYLISVFRAMPVWCIYFQGKLVGICGSVGCGKSSLISAILGRVCIHCQFLCSKSIQMPEWLVYLTLICEVLALNPTRGSAQLMIVLHFISQSLSLSPFCHLNMI